MYVLKALLIETDNFTGKEQISDERTILVSNNKDEINIIKNIIESLVEEYNKKLPTPYKINPSYSIQIDVEYIPKFSIKYVGKTLEELSNKIEIE